MANYDSIDLLVTDDGDIDIGANGDISVTEEDQILSLQQKILSVLKSDIGDWEDHPMISANLQSFVGERNSRENAKKIESSVKNALVDANIVRTEDVEVEVNAVSIYSVFIVVRVRATPTILNSLIDGELTVGVFFNSADGNIIWGNAPQGGV